MKYPVSKPCQKCCIPMCNNSLSDTNNLALFYVVPKNHKILRQKWLTMINYGNNLKIILCKRGVICSAHFLQSDFKFNHKTSKLGLEDSAVPSIFPWSNNLTVHTTTELIVKETKHIEISQKNAAVQSSVLDSLKPSHMEVAEYHKETCVGIDQSCSTINMDKIVATNSSVGDVIAHTNKKNDPCNIKGLLPENVAETFEELRAHYFSNESILEETKVNNNSLKLENTTAFSMLNDALEGYRKDAQTVSDTRQKVLELKEKERTIEEKSILSVSALSNLFERKERIHRHITELKRQKDYQQQQQMNKHCCQDLEQKISFFYDLLKHLDSEIKEIEENLKSVTEISQIIAQTDLKLTHAQKALDKRRISLKKYITSERKLVGKRAKTCEDHMKAIYLKAVSANREKKKVWVELLDSYLEHIKA